MEKYKICIDAGGDIDKKYLMENSICFVPMDYSVGEEQLVCSGLEPSSNMVRFYEAQKNGEATKTTQVTPYGYENYFRSILEEGYSILYLSLSSGLSNTFQSSLSAAQNLEKDFSDRKVISIDSLSATGGIGVLAHKAVRNLKKGMSLADNAADVKKATFHMKHFFMVDDLMFLKKGGRISATTAIIGSALNIKPVLEINPEGKLDTLTKKHGNKAALNEILNLFEEEYEDKSEDVIYITHGNDQAKADYLKEKILEKHPNAVIYTEMLCPVIGAHTGPGMASVCFKGKER